MSTELFVAMFVMAVGLSVAGAGTHLYQGVFKEQAALRFDGGNILGMLGNLAMSFMCGPYIMLKMGWGQDQRGNASRMTSVLIAAFVAFGWAFITGLLFVSSFMVMTGI